MKVYVITQAEFDDLFARLELQAFRRDNVLSKTEEPVSTDSMYRAFIYVTRQWAESVGHDPKFG